MAAVRVGGPVLAALLLVVAACTAQQPPVPGDAALADGSAIGDTSQSDGGLIAPDAVDAASLNFDGPPPSTQAQGYGLAPAFTAGPSAEQLKRLKYTGQGTNAYGDLPVASTTGVSLACGFGYISPVFQAAYVGVGSSFYQKGFGCGRCLKLQCDDVSCTQPGRQALAQIVDLCGDCMDADLSVSLPLFRNVTGRDPANNPSVILSWELVDCAPYINGTIKMLVKPGGSAYYQAFNFANANQVITAAAMNGQTLKRGQSNYWEWNPGQAINPKGPFQLAIQAANKQVLRVKLHQLRSQDLQVQFKTS